MFGKYVRYLMADDIGVWETEEILCGNQAEILTAEELPLQRIYGGYTGEPRQEIFREHSHDTGTFYYVGAHDRGAMIFNYDFHGADLIALLFAFMVLYSGVVAVLTDK